MPGRGSPVLRFYVIVGLTTSAPMDSPWLGWNGTMNKAGYLGYIHSFRGFAILNVVAVHALSLAIIIPRNWVDGSDGAVDRAERNAVP